MSEQPETDSLPKRGRPSKKSPELLDEILDRLAEGEPLAQICRDEHMPSWRTVYDWIGSDADFSAGFARARAHGFDVIAADVLNIADTPREGIIEKVEPDEAGNLRVVERRHEDMLGHRRLQAEMRLKLLAKWDPKRYGERIAQELSGPEGGPIQSESKVTLAPDEAYRALLG